MTASAGDVLLAHGGGVPEALMIGVPLLLIGGFVLLERQARRREREAESEAAEGDKSDVRE